MYLHGPGLNLPFKLAQRINLLFHPYQRFMKGRKVHRLQQIFCYIQRNSTLGIFKFIIARNDNSCIRYGPGLLQHIQSAQERHPYIGNNHIRP